MVGDDHGSGPPTQRSRSSEADVSHIKCRQAHLGNLGVMRQLMVDDWSAI